MARLKPDSSALLIAKPKVRALKSIKQWIHEGKLPTGEKLPSEQALASYLSVARSAVRSALEQLEDEGLVKPEGKRGRIVTESGGGNVTVMNQTVAILSDFSDQPPLYQRSTGWEVYIHVGTVNAIREAGLHALTLHWDLMTPDQITRLIHDRPTGVVIRRDAALSAKGQQVLHAMKQGGVPVVVLGYSPELIAGFDTVAADHQAGAYKLTRWLIERGARRILRFWALAKLRPLPAWLEQRNIGYERAMREAGLELLPPVYSGMPMGYGDGVDGHAMDTRLAAGLLLDHFQHPKSIDAIMSPSDGETYGISSAVRLFGKTPGKDVLIVGYDNYFKDLDLDRHGETCDPSATVDKQNLKVGKALLEMLLARNGGKLPEDPQLHMIEPELVVIDSNAHLAST